MGTMKSSAMSKSIFRAIGVLIAAVLAVPLVGGQSATAAERTGVISNIHFTRTTTINQGYTVKVAADWAVTNPSVGDTFSLTLPEEFERSTQSFSLTDKNDKSKTWATCEASSTTPSVITCTLTDAVAGMSDVDGDMYFNMTAIETTTETSVGFGVDGEVVTVELPGGGGIGEYIPPKPPTTSHKNGWQRPDGTLGWEIVVLGSDFEDISNVVVQDCLAESPEVELPDNKIIIYTRGEDTDWTQTQVVEGVWETTADGTCFKHDLGKLDPATYYKVVFYVDPVDEPEVGDVFTNSATINGDTYDSRVVYIFDGGGTGDGDEVAQFNVVKEISGTAADSVPADAEFTVQYSYDDTTDDLTVTTGGDPVSSAEFAGGAEVTITELELPEIEEVSGGLPCSRVTGSPTTVMAPPRSLPRRERRWPSR